MSLRAGNRYAVGMVALILMVVVSALGPAAALAEFRICILMFSEEPRHAAARQGFFDQLYREGFKAADFTVLTDVADASKAKAAELAAGLAAKKPDLIFTLGTSGTIPVARAVKDIPIVFSIVYDPVAAGVAEDWISSGNNTTGASTMVPASHVLHVLKQMRPVKQLAVLYTPGEKNSEFQLLALQQKQVEQGIKVIPVILSGPEDVSLALPEVVRTADAIYITGSKVAGNSIKTIVAAANQSGVVTVSHLDDLVEQGVLLGVCSDSYRLGLLAGKQAARILRGTKPASLPIELDRTPEVIINRSSLQAGHFNLSAVFLEKVTKYDD